MSDLAGYLLYVGFVLVPGLGVGWLIGVVKKHNLLVENLGYAVGLGLGVDTAILALGTSGLRIGPIALQGVGGPEVAAPYAIGLIAAGISLVLRRPVTNARPTRADLAVLGMMVIQAGLFFLYFQKYPIFPEFSGADFVQHVQITQGLLSGASSFPSGLLYNGVHFQIGAASVATGRTLLVVEQRVAAVLAVLATPIFYLAAAKLFKNPVASLSAAFLYSLTGTIWFVGLLDGGLYPNFFGIIASIFLVVCFVDATGSLTSSSFLVFVIALVLAAYSHYSTVVLFAAVAIVPLILIIRRVPARNSLVLATTILVPAAAGAVLFPQLLGLLLGYSQVPGGGGAELQTAMSSALSAFPSLSFLAAETYYDIGFVIIISLAILYSWRLVREPEPFLLLPMVWFLALLVSSPFNEGAWRYSYVALTPLALMVAGALGSLLPQGRQAKRGRQRTRNIQGGVVLVLILVAAGGWTPFLITDATSYSSNFAQSQQQVYESFLWMGRNFNRSVTCLSVSDWRFQYTQVLLGIQSEYVLFYAPAPAIAAAKAAHISCLIVTRDVTAAVPPDSLPWNSFPSSSDSNLTLQYSNPDVRIYKVT